MLPFPFPGLLLAPRSHWEWQFGITRYDTHCSSWNDYTKHLPLLFSYRLNCRNSLWPTADLSTSSFVSLEYQQSEAGFLKPDQAYPGLSLLISAIFSEYETDSPPKCLHCDIKSWIKSPGLFLRNCMRICSEIKKSTMPLIPDSLIVSLLFLS